MSQRNIRNIIRNASVDDAPAICEVLKLSILELCVADHRNDPAILARWLRNKTPEHIASEIAQPENSTLVAISGAAILGVGLVTDAGEVHLNYVSPEARFRGASRALMQSLEARAIERGATYCTLTSTETARRFYLSGGYTENGEVVFRFSGDCPGYRMFKPLASQAYEER